MILNAISGSPTRIAEWVPLLLAAEATIIILDWDYEEYDSRKSIPNPRWGFVEKPPVWRLEWPKSVIDKLVTNKTLIVGAVCNSDLKLASGRIPFGMMYNYKTFGLWGRSYSARQPIDNTRVVP